MFSLNYEMHDSLQCNCPNSFRLKIVLTDPLSLALTVSFQKFVARCFNLSIFYYEMHNSLQFNCPNSVQ